MRFEKVIAISVVCACGASCADDDVDNPQDVSAFVDGAYAVDGTDAANWDAAMTYAATDAIDDPFYLAQRSGSRAAKKTPVSDPRLAAKSAAEAADNYFLPSSCVTATADGNQVTYELSSCSGPLGMVSASGTIVVAFSAPGSADADEDASIGDDAGAEGDAGAGHAGLSVDVTSRELSINNAAATLDAHGTYSRNASGDKQIVLRSKGTHARSGVNVQRNLMATIRWNAGSQCIEVDANGTLDSNGKTFDVSVDDYTRCGGDCPKAGTVRIVGDSTVTLTLDGTDQPEYSSSNGSSGTVTLDCD